MSLLNLRDSCRLYERRARKVRGAPMSMEQFNDKHQTSLPTSSKAIRVHKRYLKQLARAKKQHGVPLNAGVPSLYKALQSESEGELKPSSFSNVAENIPTRREPVAVSSPSVGAVPKVESSVSMYMEAKEEFTPPAAKATVSSIADAALAEIKPAKKMPSARTSANSRRGWKPIPVQNFTKPHRSFISWTTVTNPSRRWTRPPNSPAMPQKC